MAISRDFGTRGGLSMYDYNSLSRKTEGKQLTLCSYIDTIGMDRIGLYLDSESMIDTFSFCGLSEDVFWGSESAFFRNNTRNYKDRRADITKLAKFLTTNTTIKTLNLSSNELSNYEMGELVEALAVNTTLLTLDLTENNIDGKGFVTLFEGLRLNTTLQTLRLGQNVASISEPETNTWKDLVCKNTTLTSLDFSNSGVGSVVGSDVAGDIIIGNTTLKHLFLGDSYCTGLRAQSLAYALGWNSTLIHIDLSNNHLDDAGVTGIAEAFETNSSITTLNLINTSFGEKGAQAIGKMLSVNSTLVRLMVDNNTFGNEGILAIAQGLKVNSSLTRLDAMITGVTSGVFPALVGLLSYNKTITCMDLGVWSQKQSAKCFENILFNNRKLAPNLFTMIFNLTKPNL